MQKIIIIGAGSTGLAVASEIAKTKNKVIVLEKITSGQDKPVTAVVLSVLFITQRKWSFLLITVCGK